MIVFEFRYCIGQVAQIETGNRGYNRSWDSLFGERWDIWPGGGQELLDTIIRAIRF